MLIKGIPGDWAGALTDDALIRAAGDATVAVEVRPGGGGAYGLGRKRRMRFADFVRAAAASDARLYLTAQQARVSASDGHLELTAPPVTQLLPLLPLEPGFAPHLVPQSINMWMGAAPDGERERERDPAVASGVFERGQSSRSTRASPQKHPNTTTQRPPKQRQRRQRHPPPPTTITGSSTGLHHDFHDNVYALLRGRKRFRLFPPSDLPKMYVRGGRPARAHANGRIVYEGQGDVAADGSDAREAARGARGAAAALEAAEAKLEALLERGLAAGGGGGSDGGDDDDFDAMVAAAGGDDYADSDDDAAAGVGGGGSSSSSDGEDDGGSDGGGAGGRRALYGDRRKRRKKEKRGGGNGSDKRKRPTRGGGKSGEGGDEDADADEPPPPSFSRVDLSLPPAELKRRFPLFPGVGAALVAEVGAGQCLYLPCGWFHEVTSYSAPGEQRQKER